jgi:hypothetical protein
MWYMFDDDFDDDEYIYVCMMSTCIKSDDVIDDEVLYKHMHLMNHMFMHS